jgi:hypothetical protein
MSGGQGSAPDAVTRRALLGAGVASAVLATSGACSPSNRRAHSKRRA